MNHTERKDISIFERHPRITIACFFIAAFFILDFVSANIYKFFNGYPWACREADKAQYYWELGGIYHTRSKFYDHDLIAKNCVRILWRAGIYAVYTNSLGFIDKTARDVPLISNKHRIVFIGDSFTEGMGLEYGYTFVGLIDAGLSKNGIEVLNAGVFSYSPIIYWRKVKYLIEDIGLKFDQLVVFLDISDAYDEAMCYCLDESGNVVYHAALPSDYGPVENERYYAVLLKRLKTSIRDNSILVYTAYATLHKINDMISARISSGKNKLHQEEFVRDNKKGSWTVDNKLYQEYGQQGLRKMQLYMDKLYVLLKKNNIKLTVAVYPWPTQIIHNDLNSIQVTFWEEWCLRHDVNFINYFPFFVIGKTEKDRKQIVGKYFFENDVHWNKEGHRLIADVFLTNFKFDFPK